jgi:hypothetical protein
MAHQYRICIMGAHYGKVRYNNGVTTGVTVARTHGVSPWRIGVGVTGGPVA